MILSLVDVAILGLGIYVTLSAERATACRSALATIGLYLGGLLIVGGFALIGAQLAYALGLAAAIRI
jgi:hypothetical protein